MKSSEVLQRAKILLERHENEGGYTTTDRISLICAISHVVSRFRWVHLTHPYAGALRVLREVIKCPSITDYEANHTHAEVLRKIDEAIDLSKSRGD